MQRRLNSTVPSTERKTLTTVVEILMILLNQLLHQNRKMLFHQVALKQERKILLHQHLQVSVL